MPANRLKALLRKTSRAIYYRLPLSERKKRLLKSFMYEKLGFLIRNTETYKQWHNNRLPFRKRIVDSKPEKRRHRVKYPVFIRQEHKEVVKTIAGSGLFDPSFYLQQYHGARTSGMDPLVHYVLHGAREGNDPNPLFDTETYSVVTGIDISKVNPLLHFIENGCVPKAGAYPDADALIEIQTKLYRNGRLDMVKDSRKDHRGAAVFIQCGPDSRHTDWYEAGTRSWDFYVNYYDDRYMDSSIGDVLFLQKGPGSKCSAFWTMIRDYPKMVWEYDYWLLMDDDLITSIRDIDRFIEVVADKNLDLAQLSLTHDSYCAWPMFKTVSKSTIRPVNGVEIMSPVLSRRTLRVVKHLFSQTVSGWGIGLALGKIVREKIGTVPAVVDTCFMKHTKPIDTSAGSYYSFLQKAGISARVELRHLQRLYDTETVLYEL
ncbi:MAG: DUF707 domain-containing protein [Spirochaetes bacterium]|nr:DUF707 domain-containing protein [Spirochaetota bacterium]